ncbi:dienelactone hydrolase family protein [bacterium]|nr:dienelactone hydrolase family protein [bacterium]
MSVLKFMMPIFLCAGFLGLSCSLGTESESENPNFTLSDGSISLNYVNMKYTKAVHKSESPDKPPMALIVALHYGGEPHDDFGREFLEALVLPAYSHLRAVIVAPVVPETGTWADGQSEKFILALVDKMKSAHRINSSQVMLMGYSLGGIGTWYMAARNTDIFTAAIPMSCLPPDNVLPIDDLPPTYVIHSDADEVFPFSEAEDNVMELQGKGLPVEFSIVEDVTHYSTSGFIPALEESLTWLVEQWD